MTVSKNVKYSELPKTAVEESLVPKRRKPFEKDNTLGDKWIGPYLVTKDFNNRGFKITDLRGRKFRYNIKDLKECSEGFEMIMSCFKVWEMISNDSCHSIFYILKLLF